jgi:2-haloacid dehalogenase
VDRWASFDCYGTLVDWRGGIHAELARLFGQDAADGLLVRYHELEPAAQASGELPYRQVLSSTLAAVAAEQGLAVPAGEEDALARSLPAWPVFTEVPASLETLRERGWRLGILSNTDPDLLAASMAAIGVPVDVTVVASEIGSYKPAHRHWQVFAERSGANPERHVHVAASLFHDIAATDELGIRSVWINRLAEQPGPAPTRELPDLGRLADTLDELVPQ